MTTTTSIYGRTITAEQWYGHAIDIPRSDSKAFVPFISSCTGLVGAMVKKKLDRQVSIALSYDVPTAYADPRESKIVLSKKFVEGDFSAIGHTRYMTGSEIVGFLLGVIVHEIGHFAYSPDDLAPYVDHIAKTYPNAKLGYARNLANILEDIHIEHQIARLFPTLSWTLTSMNRILLTDKMYADSIKLAKQIKLPATDQLVNINNYLLFGKVVKTVDTTVSPYCRNLFELAISVRKMTELQDRINLCALLYRLIVVDMPNLGDNKQGKQDKKPSQNNDQSDDQDNNDQSDDDSDNSSDDDQDDQSDDNDQDNGNHTPDDDDDDDDDDDQDDQPSSEDDQIDNDSSQTSSGDDDQNNDTPDDDSNDQSDSDDQSGDDSDNDQSDSTDDYDDTDQIVVVDGYNAPSTPHLNIDTVLSTDDVPVDIDDETSVKEIDIESVSYNFGYTLELSDRYSALSELAKQRATVVKAYGENLRRGTQFRDLHRIVIDQRIFANPLPIEHFAPMEVIIVLDCSWSMSGNMKFWNAAHATLGTALALINGRCQVQVYGHTANTDKNPDVTIYPLLLNGENIDLLNSRLANVAHNMRGYRDILGNNRDGTALKYIATKFNPYAKAKKLMLVISDGAPFADGAYHLKELGVAHTAVAVESIRNSGIQVLSLSIDLQAFAPNNKIYGEDSNVCDQNENALADLVEKILIS